jgi:hypothetical protein
MLVIDLLVPLYLVFLGGFLLGMLGGTYMMGSTVPLALGICRGTEATGIECRQSCVQSAYNGPRGR